MKHYQAKSYRILQALASGNTRILKREVKKANRQAKRAQHA